MRTRDQLDWVVTALAAVCLGAVPTLGQEGPPPAPVQIGLALEQEMAPSLWVPGTVVSRNEAGIAAEVSGRLTWVAEVGDRVRQGEPVARIDDQALQLRLRNDEATIKRLEAQLEYLDQQVLRLRRLTEQQVAPVNDLEQAESQLQAVQQEVVQARVARETTVYQLERCQVRAPFSGEVVQRLQPTGSYSSVGEEIVHLVDTADVEVRAQAPVSVAPFLSEGMQVSVTDGSRELAGEVRRVVPVGDQRSRMFELRVALAERPWIVGTAARVELPAGSSRRIIAVPRDALILRSGGTFLFKVSEDGTAERVAVETGAGHASLIEVRGDVESGDQVVVRGGERLRPGQRVVVAAGRTPAG